MKTFLRQRPDLSLNRSHSSRKRDLLVQAGLVSLVFLNGMTVVPEESLAAKGSVTSFPSAVRELVKPLEELLSPEDKKRRPVRRRKAAPFPQAKPLTMKDVEPVPLEKPEGKEPVPAPVVPAPQPEDMAKELAKPEAAPLSDAVEKTREMDEEQAVPPSEPALAVLPEAKPGPAVPTKPVSPTPLEPSQAAEAAPEEPASPGEACKIEWAKFEPRPQVEGEGDCGFEDAVQLSSLQLTPEAGFSPQPTVTCALGEKVAEWLAKDVAPLSKTLLGEDLVRIETGPGYSCRLRNNGKTGKISEHARGNALDIAGFVLSSGETVTIADDWDKNAIEAGPKARFLRAVHTAACQRFTTVLGPEADVHHKSHLHVDIGCHGKSCTYLICQ